MLGLGIQGKHDLALKNGNLGDKAGAHNVAAAIGGGNALEGRQHYFLSNISHHSPLSGAPLRPKGLAPQATLERL